jgi:predicted ArsR family transcriptional regulator
VRERISADRRRKMSWLERVMGETRVHLLVMVRRAKRTVSGMAEALGISDNAVRTHIAAMQRDGMVEPAGVVRGTGGKPAQLYQISDEGEEIFPKAYCYVLNRLLELIEQREGSVAAEGLLREIGRRAAGEVSGSGADPAVRVEQAADALRRLGGDVEVVAGEEVWEIRGYGCPLSAVVAEHEVVCTLAESLVAGITGGLVRECCDRGGRPRCRFEVELGAGSGAPRRSASGSLTPRRRPPHGAGGTSISDPKKSALMNSLFVPYQ